MSLTLIGDGPLNQHLRQIGNGHKNISFVGAQEPDMITTALENMNIGWNLLDDSSQSYYYSLANKFFDYLHHGLPVITMDFPEYKEVIDHYNCGFLLPNIEEGTIDKMLDQLELSFNQDGTFEHYYKNCLRAAQENNWDQESSKLLELINSV